MSHKYDFSNPYDIEIAQKEVAQYLTQLVKQIMDEAGCKYGDAINVYCRLPDIPSTKYEEDDPSYSEAQKLGERIASYHSLVATKKMALGNATEAAQHWVYFKVTLAEFFRDDNDARDKIISDLSRKAAGARHAENRAMKDQALAWYVINKSNYSNKDDAAIAITKIVPVKFSTAREWIKNR